MSKTTLRIYIVGFALFALLVAGVFAYGKANPSYLLPGTDTGPATQEQILNNKVDSRSHPDSLPK